MAGGWITRRTVARGGVLLSAIAAVVMAVAVADDPLTPAFQDIRRTAEGMEVVGETSASTNRLDIYRCTNLALGEWTLLITTTNTPSSSNLAWTDSDTLDAPVVYYRIGNADVDTDGDGLPDAREICLYHTQPGHADTDGDGLPDGWEVSNGLSPTNSADASADDDGDGIPNLREYQQGTDPRNRSSHGPRTLYVSAEGSHTAPFLSWPTAARDIQSAIDVSDAGDTVLVTNGVYSEGGVALVANMTNRVAITNGVVVRSVNGPAVTVITGRAAPAARCAFVGNGGCLSGFTLTGGSTLAGGDASREQSGGGAWCESGGTISNCVISSNVACRQGGGVYGGSVVDSVLSGNLSLEGGGAAGAALDRCLVSRNTASGGRGIPDVLTAAAYNGYIRSSADKGGSWSVLTNLGYRAWACVLAQPPNFSTLSYTNILGAEDGGYLYGSRDLGASVTTNTADGARSRLALAASRDGRYVVQAVWSDFVRYSSNYGVTWMGGGLAMKWTDIAMSQDGTRIYASTHSPNAIFLSVDRGATWNRLTNAPPHSYYGIACSSNGQFIVACGDYNGASRGIAVSTDSGVSWSVPNNSPFAAWQDCAISGDGRTMYAVGQGYRLWRSRDAGESWMECTNCTRYGGVSGLAMTMACSGSGEEVLVGTGNYDGGNGLLYVSTDGCESWTPLLDTVGTAWYAVYVSQTGQRSTMSGGGALDCTVTSSVLSGNRAGGLGGGLCGGAGVNCTLVDNVAESGQGGGAANAALTNCIVLDNKAAYGSDNHHNAAMSHCCTAPQPAGIGNTTNEPWFVDASVGDYRLQPWSRCLDAGYTERWMTNSADLAGGRRLVNDAVDIGAYESPSGRFDVWLRSQDGGKADFCVTNYPFTNQVDCQWIANGGVARDWAALPTVDFSLNEVASESTNRLVVGLTQGPRHGTILEVDWGNGADVGSSSVFTPTPASSWSGEIGTVIRSQTMNVVRRSAWQRFYLSSSIGAGRGWPDATGIRVRVNGTLYDLPADDSVEITESIPFSGGPLPPQPPSVTAELTYTGGGTVECERPIHLLAWKPGIDLTWSQSGAIHLIRGEAETFSARLTSLPPNNDDFTNAAMVNCMWSSGCIADDRLDSRQATFTRSAMSHANRLEGETPSERVADKEIAFLAASGDRLPVNDASYTVIGLEVGLTVDSVCRLCSNAGPCAWSGIVGANLYPRDVSGHLTMRLNDETVFDGIAQGYWQMELPDGLINQPTAKAAAMWSVLDKSASAERVETPGPATHHTLFCVATESKATRALLMSGTQLFAGWTDSGVRAGDYTVTWSNPQGKSLALDGNDTGHMSWSLHPATLTVTTGGAWAPGDFVDVTLSNSLCIHPATVRLFLPVLVDLDVDSDNNNGLAPDWTATAEEDRIEDEEGNPGKIIGVACGDSDGDGIPDFADGFNLDGNASTEADNQSTHRLAPLRFTIGVSDPADLARARIRFLYDGAPSVEVRDVQEDVDWSCKLVRRCELPAPAPRLRLWFHDGATVRENTPIDQNGDSIAPHVFYYPRGRWNDTQTEFVMTVYAEALTESATPGDITIKAEVDFNGNGALLCGDQVRLTALKPDLQLYSRNDISLMLDDPQNEAWEDVEPFAFWVNDNKEGVGVGGDAAYDGRKKAMANLLDLAPFAVRIPQVVEPSALPSTYRYRLRIDNPATGSQNFKMKMYYDLGNNTTNKIPEQELPYAYLRAEDAAVKQVAAEGVVFEGAVGCEVANGSPRTLKSADVADGGQKPFVLEGTGWGKARLYLDLYDERTETVIASDSAMVELPKAPDENTEGGYHESVAAWMTEWNLRSTRAWWQALLELRARSSDELPVRKLELGKEKEWWIRYPADKGIPEADRQKRMKQCIFYVHGFNERDSEARVRKQRPIFRRLYWAGIPVHRYQSACFVAVQWPGDVGRVRWFDGLRFNYDVVPAFYAGKELGEGWRLQQQNPDGILSGARLHVIAHSLGNCVVGQAIQTQSESGGARIATYSMVECAITASAFDRGDMRSAVMPGNVGYAEYTGYSENGEMADEMWRARWQNPTAAFGALADGWEWVGDPETGQPLERVLRNRSYLPWTDDNWQSQWAAEAKDLLDIKVDLPGLSSSSDVYTKRWTQECWGPDHNPWRGLFDKVVDATEVHNFVTSTNAGPYVSDVLRWEPEALLADKEFLPKKLLTMEPAWHLNQAHGRPEDGGHGNRIVGLSTKHESERDPDGVDAFDEDLSQSPWDRENIPDAMRSGWANNKEAQQECRRYAELAHYFVELGCPAAVNPIAGLDGKTDRNEMLDHLDKVMNAQHSYFVVNENYWIVYQYVFGKMRNYIKP